jgi:hypothetical protein
MVPNHLKAEGHHREEVPSHIHLSIGWGIVLLDIDFEVIALARRIRDNSSAEPGSFVAFDVIRAVAEAADHTVVHDNGGIFHHDNDASDYLYSNDSGTVRIPDDHVTDGFGLTYNDLAGLAYTDPVGWIILRRFGLRKPQ